MTTQTLVPILKVSKDTRPKSLAAALIGSMKEHGTAELQAISEKAVYNATKALAHAQRFPDCPPNLICIPSTTIEEHEGDLREIICLRVEAR